MKILGICGSIRQSSSNYRLLQFAKSQLQQHEWLDFQIASLPYFDPDLQFSSQTPESAKQLRSLAAAADRIVICTPEYAHGIPGILKNAFEWLFYEGTQKKPVYVIIGSAEGENTRDQLIEVLSTMDFQITTNQVLLVKGARAYIQTNGDITDVKIKAEVIDFCQSIE